MDYQEAMEKHEKDCRRCREKIYKHAIKKFSCLQEIDIKAYEELMSYRQIGTLDEVREAVEKRKRKKPRATTNRCYVCPHCGLVTSIKIKHNYCDACGQHIDWSDKE